MDRQTPRSGPVPRATVGSEGTGRTEPNDEKMLGLHGVRSETRLSSRSLPDITTPPTETVTARTSPVTLVCDRIRRDLETAGGVLGHNRRVETTSSVTTLSPALSGGIGTSAPTSDGIVVGNIVCTVCGDGENRARTPRLHKVHSVVADDAAESVTTLEANLVRNASPFDAFPTTPAKPMVMDRFTSPRQTVTKYIGHAPGSSVVTWKDRIGAGLYVSSMFAGACLTAAVPVVGFAMIATTLASTAVALCVGKTCTPRFPTPAYGLHINQLAHSLATEDPPECLMQTVEAHIEVEDLREEDASPEEATGSGSCSSAATKTRIRTERRLKRRKKAVATRHAIFGPGAGNATVTLAAAIADQAMLKVPDIAVNGIRNSINEKRVCAVVGDIIRSLESIPTGARARVLPAAVAAFWLRRGPAMTCRYTMATDLNLALDDAAIRPIWVLKAPDWSPAVSALPGGAFAKWLCSRWQAHIPQNPHE